MVAGISFKQIKLPASNVRTPPSPDGGRGSKEEGEGKGKRKGEEGGLREGDLKCHIKPNHDGKLLRTGTKSRRSLARVGLHCVRAFSSVLPKRRDPLSADGASGGTNAFSAAAIRRKIAALAADPSPSRERSASCQAVILDVIRSAALQHFGNVGSAAHKNARKNARGQTACARP